MSYLKSTVLILLLCLATVPGFSQAPPLFGWQKCLGGSSVDAAQKIISCTNGELLVIGNTQSVNGDVTTNHGSRDYWMSRLDASGQLLWGKTYGGTGSDIATSACELADGKIIISGYSSSNNGDVSGNHGNFDVWVVKTDAAGNMIWQKTFGGTNNDFAESITPTADGGFVLGGSSYSTNGNVTGNHGDQDFWIVKTDSMGNIQWQKSIGGSAFEQCFSVLLLEDGSYLACGVSSSSNGDVSSNHGMNDCMIAHLDVNGTLLWTGLYGGSVNESAFHCVQNVAGDLVITGYTNSSDGDVTSNRGSSDVWLLGLDINGVLLFSKTFGGTNSDIGYSVDQNDGGYLIASSTFSTDQDIQMNHGGEDVLLIQTDLAGNKIWTRTYGGSAHDHPASYTGNYNVGFTLAGYTYSNNGDVFGNHGSSDIWLCKLACLAPVMSFTNPVDSFCMNTSSTFSNGSVNASLYQWRVNGMATLPVQNLTYSFDSAGSFQVELTGSTCMMTDTFAKTLVSSPIPNPVVTTSANLICNNDSVLLTSTAADNYSWSSGAVTQSVWISTAGNYSVNVTTAGCQGASAPVTITSHVIPTFSLGNDTVFCSGSNFWITAPAGYTSYSWQDGSPYRSFIATLPGTYTLTVSDGVCDFTESIVVDTLNCSLPVANFTAARLDICENESVDFSDLSMNATSWQWSFPGGTPSTSNQRNPSGIVYSIPGQYDVNLIISNATGSNANFRQNFITVNPAPVKPSITATGTILISSQQAFSYQWFRDSIAVNGATSQAYIATQSGHYTVRITTSAGCSSTSDPMYIGVTGISQVSSSENFFQVFPNPATGNVSLSFHHANTESYRLDILDIAGHLVYTSRIEANNKTPHLLSLGYLPAGFYMIHASSSTDSFVSRLQLIH
jgi:PKD repeat protein